MDTTAGKDFAEVAAACAGDDQAIGRLLTEYAPLIESSVASFAASVKADDAEVRSEAVCAFYRAVLSFDQAQDHTTFGLYAKICIRNRLISKFVRPRRVSETVSLDELYRCADMEEVFSASYCEMPGDRLTEDESLQLLYRKIGEVLSAYELSVFHLWAEGYAVQEIALHLGRTEKSVSNALARSLAKLRRTLS